MRSGRIAPVEARGGSTSAKHTAAMGPNPVKAVLQKPASRPPSTSSDQSRAVRSATLTRELSQTPISAPRAASCTLLGGGVSERPKEHASKACEGVTPPWVQIPPPPLGGVHESARPILTKVLVRGLQ